MQLLSSGGMRGVSEKAVAITASMTFTVQFVFSQFSPECDLLQQLPKDKYAENYRPEKSSSLN